MCTQLYYLALEFEVLRPLARLPSCLLRTPNFTKLSSTPLHFGYQDLFSGLLPVLENIMNTGNSVMALRMKYGRQRMNTRCPTVLIWAWDRITMIHGAVLNGISSHCTSNAQDTLLFEPQETLLTVCRMFNFYSSISPVCAVSIPRNGFLEIMQILIQLLGRAMSSAHLQNNTYSREMHRQVSCARFFLSSCVGASSKLQFVRTQMLSWQWSLFFLAFVTESMSSNVTFHEFAAPNILCTLYAISRLGASKSTCPTYLSEMRLNIVLLRTLAADKLVCAYVDLYAVKSYVDFAE